MAAYNLEMDHPVRASLASLVGGHGLLASLLRREGERRLMPYRSPDRRAVTPQGRGRFPGYDVLADPDDGTRSPPASS